LIELAKLISIRRLRLRASFTLLERGIIMQKLSYTCGIDIAKNSFTVAIKNGTFIVKDKTFSMDREGFDKFDSLMKDFKEDSLIGIESTGIYHNNLFDFLGNKGYSSVVVNPYMVHQFFKFTSNKPTKTDMKDARTICEFVELKKDELVKENQQNKDEKDRLKYLVREKEEITHRIAQTKTEIRRILYLLFPEIENKVGLFGEEMRALLFEFSSAHKIRSISKNDFIKKVNKLTVNKGRGTRVNLEKIYELACSSIAQDHPSYEELLKMKFKRLAFLFEEREHITRLIDASADKDFAKEIEILISIPGVGRESAIYLIAEIVDIKRFPHWKKLVGFCGLDPVIKQSGKFRTNCKISKRGNSHARRILWIMAGCAKRRSPYFRDYYLKKRAEGKSYREAVIATSTKLLRVIYALLNKERRFQ